jgi:hypothetical protein
MNSYLFTITSAIAVGIMLIWWIRRYGEKGRDQNLALLMTFAIFSVTAIVGLSGILADFSSFPPRVLFFLLALFIAAYVFIGSNIGGRLATATPLRVFIGMQGFRILPEVMLDVSWRDGLAPIQMTWHGRNWDVLSALAAIMLFLFWNILPQKRLWATLYTGLGLGLLANILVIAILSMPTPLRVFFEDPPNNFVAIFPYIWLPGVHVLTAITLHGLTIRKLLSGPAS